MKHKPDCKSPELMRFSPEEDYITQERRHLHFIQVEEKLSKLAKDKPGFEKNFTRVKNFVHELSVEFYLRYRRVLIIPNVILLDDSFNSIELEWLVGESDMIITFRNDFDESILMSGSVSEYDGLDASSDYEYLIIRVIGWLTDFKRDRSQHCVSCDTLFETEELRKP